MITPPVLSPAPAESSVIQTATEICIEQNFPPNYQEEYQKMKASAQWLPQEPLALCESAWLNSEAPEDSLGISVMATVDAQQHMMRAKMPQDLLLPREFIIAGVGSFNLTAGIQQHHYERTRQVFDMISELSGENKVFPYHIQYLLGCSIDTAQKIFSYLSRSRIGMVSSNPPAVGLVIAR